MKTLAFIASLILVVTFTGCASHEAKIEKRNVLNNLPEWYRNPNVFGDEIAAVGSAKPNSAGNLDFQKNEATTQARAELAHILESRLDARTSTSTENNAIGYKHTVSEKVTNTAVVVLKKSTVRKMFLDEETGIMYVLMVVDPSALI